MKKRLIAIALMVTMLWSSGLDALAGLHGAFAETAPEVTEEEALPSASENDTVSPDLSAEPAAPADSAEPAAPAANAEPAAPAANAEPAAPVANAEPAAPAANAEPAAPVANAEPAAPAVADQQNEKGLPANEEANKADSQVPESTGQANADKDGPGQDADMAGTAQNTNTNGPEQNADADGPEQDKDAEGPAQNTETDETQPDADTADTANADGPEQNADEDGSAQNTNTDGTESDADTNEPTQEADSDGAAQNTDTAETEQDADTDELSQGADADESAQNTDTDGPAQDADTDGSEQNAETEGPAQDDADDGAANEASQTEQTEDQHIEPAKALAAAPAMKAATPQGMKTLEAGPSDDDDLQQKIDEAIQNAAADGQSLAKVVLKRNTVYGGDVTVNNSGENSKVTALEIEAEGSGTDGLQADGTTSFVGTLISTIQLIIKGVNLPGTVTVQNTTLDYFGTTADDEVNVKAEGNSAVNIQAGEGDDTIIVTGQETATDQETGTAQPGSFLIDGGEGRDSVSLEGQFKAKDTVLLGESVEVNAKIDAESVRIEAATESKAAEDLGDNIASVVIGKDAEVTTTGDITITAKAEQNTSIQDKQNDLQANLILTKAEVDILGKLRAGQATATDRDPGSGQDTGSGQTPAEAKGSVTISAETTIRSGYKEDGKEEAGQPSAITLGGGSAVINADKDSLIEATDSIRMEAKSGIEVSTRADSSDQGTNPFTAAETALTGEARILADGRLAAGKDIHVLSSGTLSAKTVADNADGGKDKPGAYTSLGIIRHSAEAEMGADARVTAGGNLTLESNTRRTIETRAKDNKDSSAQTDTGSNAYALLSKTWEAMKNRFDAQDRELLAAMIAGAEDAASCKADAAAITKQDLVTRAQISDQAANTTGTGDAGATVNVTGVMKVIAKDQRTLNSAATTNEGAAFAQAEGNSAVEAVIGQRSGSAAGNQPGVKAGSLEVSAAAYRMDIVTSEAGKAAKSSGNGAWDASAAVNLLADTVRAEIDENSGITLSKNPAGNKTKDGSLKVEAKEDGRALTEADGDQATGATVALNLASSAVQAKAGGIDAAGTADVTANSEYNDVTIATATAAGADSNRPNTSLVGHGLPMSKTALIDLGDLLGKDEIYKAISGTEGTFWSELNAAAGDNGTTAGGEAAKAVGETGTYAKNQFLTDMLPQSAAAVGVGRANHAALADVTGEIKAGSDISVMATVKGNNDVIGDATTITDPTDHPVTGATAIARNANKAVATINGKLEGRKITVSATDRTGTTAQANANGEEDGNSFSAIISESTVSAAAGDDTVINGTTLTFAAEKQKLSSDSYQNGLANQDWIRLTTNRDEDGNFSGKANNLKVGLSAYDIQDLMTEDLTDSGGQNYYAEAITGTEGTAGTKKAAATALILSKNTIEAILGQKAQVTLTAGGDMDLHATDETATRIVTGSGFTSGDRQDASILINRDRVKAETGAGATINADGAVSQHAGISGEIQAFSTDPGATGLLPGISRKLNLLINETRAESTAENQANIISKSKDTTKPSVSVTSRTVMDLLTLSGRGSAASGTVVTGTTANYLRDGAQATTRIGDGATLTGTNGAEIAAEILNDLTSGITAQSAAGKNEPVGAMNLILTTSAATVEGGEKINITADNQDIAIRAQNGKTDTGSRLMNATVTPDEALRTAMGGSFNVNLLNSRANVNLTSGSLTAKTGDVKILASGEIKAQLAGMAAAEGSARTGADGNVILQREKNDIGIRVEEGIQVNAGKNALLDSRYRNETLAAAGAAALIAADAVAPSGLKLTAIGTTVITVDKANTVETTAGASNITARNDGKGTQDTKLRETTVSGVHIGAGAKETTKTAGGADAESVIGRLTGTALTVRSRNTVRAIATEAVLNAIETPTDNPAAPYEQGKGGGASVSVRALDLSEELMLAGGVNYGTGIGIGANAAVRISENQVEAAAGNISAYQAARVSAESNEKLTQLNINVGVGKEEAEIGATYNDLKNKVNAGLNGKVSVYSGEEKAEGVSLTAKNDTALNSAAVALAGATDTALTPVFTYTGFGGETNATVTNGSEIVAGKDVTVQAGSEKTINQYTTGFAISGTAALSGAVSMATEQESIQARVEDGTDTKAGNLNISAESNYTMRGETAALAGSGGGTAGVNGIVNLLRTNTLAETEGNATLTGNLAVDARSTRDIINSGISASAAGYGAAGMTVMILAAGDGMDQDAADQLTYGNTNGKTTKSFDSSAMLTRLKALGIDGESVDALTLEADTAGNNVQIDTGKLSTGKANGNPTFDASSGVSGRSTEDEDDGQTGETEDIKNARDVGYANTKDKDKTEKAESTYSSKPTDSVAARIGSGATITAAGAAVNAEQETEADLFAATVSAAGTFSGGISFSAAKLYSNVIAASLGTLSLEGDLSVNAVSKSGEITPKTGSREESRLQAVRSALTEMQNDLKPTKRSIRAIGLAAGLAGKDGVAISAGTVRLDNITEATLGGKVQKAQSITVNGEAAYADIFAATFAMAGSGRAAIAASIAAAVADGTVSSAIKDGTTITDVTKEVNVTTRSVVKADTVAAAVAASSGGAVVAGLSLAANSLKQNTVIERGASITGKDGSRPNVRVYADALQTTANAQLMGAGAGFVGVGMGVAIAKVKPVIHTTLGWDGDQTKSTGLNNLGEVTVENNVKSEAGANVLTATAGGVAVAGNVLLVYNDTDALAKAGAVTGKVDSLYIHSGLKAAATSHVTAATVGGVSVGAAVNYVDLHAISTADLDATDFHLNVDTLTVQAGDFMNNAQEWATEAIASSVAASVGAVAIGVNVALARNRTENNAYITGYNLDVTNVNLHSYSKGRTEATVKGVNAGDISIAASVVQALNESTSRSYLDLKGAMNGNLDADSDTTGETLARLYSGGGSIIGVTTNVATARGRTAALAEVNIGSKPNEEYNTYKVNSSGKDDVNTLIENLAGLNVGVSVGTMVSRAFSTDVYDAKLTLSGGHYKLNQISVTTNYSTDVQADTTPSSSGVDINTVGVAVNKATARNKSYASAMLYTQGDLTIAEGRKIDDPNTTTTVQAKWNIDVLTNGSVNARAEVHPATLTWNVGLGVGVNKASAAVDGTQAAVLKLGKGGIESASEVNVISLAHRASATATVGGSGSKNKNVKIGGINVEANSAVANENFANTAAVMGGISGTYKEMGTVDNGHYETRNVQAYDYDKIVDFDPDLIVRNMWWNNPNYGIGIVLTFVDPDTGETMYEAYSYDEHDEIAAYYKEKGIPFTVEERQCLYHVVDGNKYKETMYSETVWVEDLQPGYVTKNKYDPELNILKAEHLNVYSGMDNEVYSKATANSNGSKSLSLITVGNLDAKATTGESIAVLFEGVTATITGDARLTAQSNAKATGMGFVPGAAGVGTSTTTNAKVGVGSRNQAQSVMVVIGEGAVLTAHDVSMNAFNNGYAEAHIESDKSLAVLANVSKSSQPTESWYDTLITIGKGAKVEATDGDVKLLSVDAPTAKSEVVSSGFAVGVNYNSMKGQNDIHQENNIDIVDEASVIASGDVRIEAWQSTKATASTKYDGTGIVVSSNTVSAENNIWRVVRSNIGEDAVIEAKGGNAIVYAMAGIEDGNRYYLKGKHDEINTIAKVSSGGFVGLGNSKATTNLSGVSEITVDAGASIYGYQNVKMDALSSSFAGDVRFSDDLLKTETTWTKKNQETAGIYTYAETKSEGGIPLPNAIAKANLDFDTYIDINKGNVNGFASMEFNPRTNEYELVYPEGYKNPVSIQAAQAKVMLNASNDRLYVKVGAETEGKGAAGVSNATGQIDVVLTNAVWIDNASIYAGRRILIYADNGSKRNGNDVNENWNNLGVAFEATTKSKLKGIGVSKANTRITGTQINQVRSTDKNTVFFWRNDEPMNPLAVTHHAADPTESVHQILKADATVPKILGIKLGKTVKKKVLEWYYFDRCDWCETGQEYDVEPTNQMTLRERNKLAYERALVPINDIQRMVDQIGAITRAYSGLLANQAVTSIYVLDIQHILKKDIRLTAEKIADYRLWTNNLTDHTTYLLPNAAQLHVYGNRLDYVTEALEGDALGDGETRYISIYTAVSTEAYTKGIIPIGSTGTLNLRTGELTLPSYADYELYLSEVSSEWLVKQFSDGMMRRATADQERLNACAKDGAELPEMAYADALVPEEKDGRQIYWLGNTPETAADDDEPLVYLLVNSETDEVDAYRTSVNMIADGKAPVDVSLYIYRDVKADLQEEELYDVIFFDTPAKEASVVKMITNTPGAEMQVPRSLEIGLRRFRVKNCEETAFCLNNQVMLLSTEENGRASALNGFYKATYDGDTFESAYILITGLSDNNVIITVKKDQPVWGEWTGEESAETIDGVHYLLKDGAWSEADRV